MGKNFLGLDGLKHFWTKAKAWIIDQITTEVTEAANRKADKSHTHTKSEITDFDHTHDDRYYTESEIDTKLSGKSNTNHNHDDKYLGKTAKAADSDKLDGKDSTYYLNYNNLSNKPSNATQSTAGLMSSEDKEHLDTLAALLQNKDSTIDTITEVLKAFENAPEGTNIANALAGKVDKVDGKGLSTNDFTTAEKEKLAGIESGANAYVLPAAGASLGGVKMGGDVTITDGVITVKDDSHNHIISNIDGLPSALDGKANSSHTHSQYLTTHQAIKTLKTDNAVAQSPSSGEAIAGSGTINLHKVSKTGSYNDLLNRPTKLSDFTDDMVIKFTNTTVAASAFVADNNYSNYGYCASISLNGVTANDPADVYFSGKQIEQEIYASFCESYAGGVKIYAAEKPSEAVIIPLILIHK